MTLSEELAWRGFVNQTTFDDISTIDTSTMTFYFGVDPSAPSMTIGNLATAMMVRHFIDHGHNAILLVGGATGMIGDPDGKSEERDLITFEELEQNKRNISSQYQVIFNGQDFTLVDNHDWFKDIGYLSFLRDVGKHVPMRQMLGRDFVQARLREDGAGISYAEFSYALIQGYDFLHLYREHGATLQLCGSDQWGNSIAGVELIRRIAGGEAHVWSAPLVINKATGKKFGKSEAGAVWLDESLTSPFAFYQFWLNVDDAGVEDYLKIYTLLSKQEIEDVLARFTDNKAARLAQKTLAYEVTKLVHGEAKAEAVQKASQVLFGEASFNDISTDEKAILERELPVVEFTDDELQTLVNAGLAESKKQARTFLEAGAVSVNNTKVTLDDFSLPPGKSLLQRGKNTFAIVERK
jgi:tyrosyl-tRNA synthetase